jgi:hypothetical protein
VVNSDDDGGGSNGEESERVGVSSGREEQGLGVGFIGEKGQRKRRPGRERDDWSVLQGAIDCVHQWGRTWGGRNRRVEAP